MARPLRALRSHPHASHMVLLGLRQQGSQRPQAVPFRGQDSAGGPGRLLGECRVCLHTCLPLLTCPTPAQTLREALAAPSCSQAVFQLLQGTSPLQYDNHRRMARAGTCGTTCAGRSPRGGGGVAERSCRDVASGLSSG